MATHSINLSASGTRATRDLIEEILVFARQSGVDQVTLASRAGLSPESLSRLKKAGGCRLETALDLARAAGFTTLQLAGRPAGHGAISLAARKLSAGRRIAIEGDELVQELRGTKGRGRHKAHLYGFFEELPIELVHDVILDEGLDYAYLALLAKDLGAEGETVEWLAEMAGDRVADAA